MNAGGVHLVGRPSSLHLHEITYNNSLKSEGNNEEVVHKSILCLKSHAKIFSACFWIKSMTYSLIAGFLFQSVAPSFNCVHKFIYV